ALNSDKNNDNNSDKNDADILASSSKGNTETLKFVEPIDIVKNPPKSACDFKFKGIDDFTGKVKFETHPELWFAYTEPQLKSLMGKNDFITAKASLTGLSGGIFYLILEIEIASKAAPIEFGVLDKGSALSITLMNGEVIKVANRISDPGKVDAINNKTSYEGNFQLELSQIKDLAKSEVDTVRLVWSSGFEDYDVFNVDLLMNAAQCLLDNSK
nr:hypothetical protein [Saprospiraceae bacterium]